MTLNCSRTTIFVENTFGDSWKNVNHWINSIFLWDIRHLHNSKAISEKFAVEESIHQVKLDNDIDDTESLADKVSIDVRVMILKVKDVEFN